MFNHHIGGRAVQLSLCLSTWRNSVFYSQAVIVLCRKSKYTN